MRRRRKTWLLVPVGLLAAALALWLLVLGRVPSQAAGNTCTIHSYLQAEAMSIAPTSDAASSILRSATTYVSVMFPGSRVAETTTGIITSERQPTANGRRVILLRLVNVVAVEPGGPLGMASVPSTGSVTASCTIAAFDATTGGFVYAAQDDRR